MPRRATLIVAAALFLGWLGWLGAAAVNKDRGPVVSRARAAAATHPVVATLTGGPDGAATVAEALGPAGPAAGTRLAVTNLTDATGYDGPGDYLLFLTKDAAADSYSVAGEQRSPGYETGGKGQPVVYRWTPAVRAQAKKLFP